ncbi:peptidase-like protein [Tolypothrix sp. NIES-4075]|uniref:PPC domain-containing protein n=1 Tax=Tolypothrix sp. NIES-4075 TaxID=2005459 RepID=UPI000B5C992A|nr:PPC domain-containing protein [Tolypothrix sp. NIES-4075]GAX43691.1 peptidase-like protein [Tolypothrix sp. NIES-4075]
MVIKSKYNYREKLDFILICFMSSSFLISSYALPLSALASLQPGANFIIAKPPDERQPEAVQQGIEQIPATQPTASPKPNPSIESPIPPATPGTTTTTPPADTSTPQPVNTQPTPTPPAPTSTPKPVNTQPTPTPPAPTSTPRRTNPVNTEPTAPTSTPRRTNPVNTEPTAPTSTPRRTNPVNTEPPTEPTTPAPTSTPRRTNPVNSEPTTPAVTPRRTNPVNNEPTTPAVTPRRTNPVNTEPTRPTRTYTPRPSTPTYSNPTPEPSQRRVPSRRGDRKPATNRSIENSPVSASKRLNYKQINFVDIAFGVLAPGDFKSQGRYFHFYQFQGRANQLIQIRLGGSVDQRRSSNLSLDPFMFLLDPNNNVLLKRGSGGASSEVKDAFVFVRLPANGTYTIAVTSQNPGDKGRYSLALRNDRASYSLDSESELTPQSLRRQDGSVYDISKFQGKKDQLVSIRVDSVYEEFSPYIVLMDSQGKIVAADNAKDGKYSALIDRARLPKDETYYVVVISGNSLQRGKYRLTVF